MDASLIVITLMKKDGTKEPDIYGPIDRRRLSEFMMNLYRYDMCNICLFRRLWYSL